MTQLTVTKQQASQWSTIVSVSGWENENETGRFFHAEHIFRKWADATAAVKRVEATGLNDFDDAWKALYEVTS